MNRDELRNIKGGSISAAMINSIIRGIVSICDLGRSLGSAIRRAFSGSSCPLK